jgi:hypothetical protein
MRKVLTTQSTVTCGHVAGSVQTASTAKLKIDGNPVLLQASVLGRTVASCGIPQVQGNKLCTTVLSVTNAPPPKLTVGGAPVLLDTITGTTDGAIGATPQTLLAATANQAKLVTT